MPSNAGRWRPASTWSSDARLSTTRRDPRTDLPRDSARFGPLLRSHAQARTTQWRPARIATDWYSQHQIMKESYTSDVVILGIYPVACTQKSTRNTWINLLTTAHVPNGTRLRYPGQFRGSQSIARPGHMSCAPAFGFSPVTSTALTDHYTAMNLFRFLDRSLRRQVIELPDVAAADPAPSTPDTAATLRPRVRGKFLFVGAEKLYIRGVTYGTFRPQPDGSEVPAADVVERDFALMAASGFNAVRTYTVPPLWLLDAERRKRGEPEIEAIVRAAVRATADHPAVLCYAIGNEIPAPVARWFGARRVERYLRRLYDAAKAEAPDCLVTYVNYPSTEYLRLGFLDFVCFNVYLESQERLPAYLARLHNLAGDRPIIMGELGLDSRRNGEHLQARTLDWQVRSVFASACAGAFVYAGTDARHRPGADVEDWDFGLTRRDRSAKPALRAVQEAFSEVPHAPTLPWPRVSVVVCTYNGSRTLQQCLEGLGRLDYPNYEVIVVDDGSTDRAADIARRFPVVVIQTRNQGLALARNVGLKAATGEIVAYIDDDAFPDRHWLKYLAATFLSTTHCAVGGPNIVPVSDGPIAQCVARAPGGPVHVLLSDREAEHIPGCNMAFRKECLESIGGFDGQFRVAGDDVDVCWRLQARGWTLGFSPAAVVWHHRRNVISAYWRQQKGYGKAEALLEAKWPEKYNSAGHHTFEGRLYGSGLTRMLLRRQRV